MTPILFEKDTTDFSTLGIGVLTDCVTVICKRVLNGIDELSLTYPDTGVRVAELQSSRIIYAQPEYKKDPQPYVIYQVSKPVRGLITVYARHIRERASFIPVMPFTASSLAETLTKIPDYCAETSPFSYWTDKTVTANFKLEIPASLGNVLGGMEGSILDVYGGEYEFDNFLVKIWNRRGVDRGVTLRYGKNVTDATQEESIESTITGICPFWTDSEGTLVTLPEKVVHSQNAANFPFNRTIPKDFSEQFENAPTEAQLRAAAQSYIGQAGIGVPKVSLSVSFEQLAQYAEYQDVAVLETVNLGDTVTVIFERLDVNATARVVQTEYDVLNEKYRRVSIGNVKSNLGTTINGVVQEAKTEARDTRTSLQRSIDRATEMLTGANGGYLVDIFDANGQRTGDMIMNTNDPATATNVWLRNLAGWGYSSTGVNGRYRTAITQDGHIVADFIDTGTLTANVIKAGILRSSSSSPNSWNLNTGELKAGYGTIGGWTIGDYGLSKGTTFDNHDYEVGMWSPASPVSTTPAFYVGYPTGVGSAWEYVYKVDYSGKLTATKADITGTVKADDGKIGGWIITSDTLKNDVTIDNVQYQAGIYAPDTPALNTSAFYIWDKTNNIYPFRVSYGGTTYSTDARITGGKVGGWDITGTLIKKDVTLNNLPYQIGMQAPETPNANSTAFYVGYQENNAWKYPFRVLYNGKIELKSGTIGGWTLGEYGLSNSTQISSKTYTVRLTSADAPVAGDKIAFSVEESTGQSGRTMFSVSYAGKLVAADAEISGTINGAAVTGGAVSGATISSEAEKTFVKVTYTYDDQTAVNDIILSGKYPTAAQLAKYDFNQDGNIDVSDVAILNNMLGGTKDYITKTAVLIDPEETNAPIKVRSGGALDGTTISMSDGSIIGAKYVKTASFLALNSSGTVVGTFASDGIKIYDSSRRLRAKLDSTGLYFYNTSGTVTNSYPA